LSAEACGCWLLEEGEDYIDLFFEGNFNAIWFLVCKNNLFVFIAVLG
jgi:hypothetical protein